MPCLSAQLPAEGDTLESQCNKVPRVPRKVCSLGQGFIINEILLLQNCEKAIKIFVILGLDKNYFALTLNHVILYHSAFDGFNCANNYYCPDLNDYR